jgi:flavorubredoxin
MATVTEIAPEVFRISIYVPQFDLQFNHFLVRDDEPLLYHTGMRGMFPLVREAVAGILEPSQIRWIGFSHFEVDESAPSTNGSKWPRRRRRSVVWWVRWSI